MLRRAYKILLTSPSYWPYWLGVAFACRFIFFLLVIHFNQYEKMAGFWGGMRGDSDSYITPFDNLLQIGHYVPDYRMPGYGAVYLPFRLFFSKPVACNAVIITQLLLTTFSVYALALTAKKLFKSDTLFYVTFYLFAISTFSSLMDPVILTESLSTSTLVLSVYFFISFFDSFKPINLILSGTLVTWGIFLHPAFLPFLGLFFALLLIALFRIKKRMVSSFFFLLPFILIDGSWTVRNYIVYRDPAPLTRTVLFPWIANTHLLQVINFTKAYGGDIWIVDPFAEATWFINGQPCTTGTGKKSDIVPFPDYIYTSAFNADSLKAVKNMITRITTDSASLPPGEWVSTENKIKQKLDTYTASIQREKPGLFYVKSNYIRLKAFLFSIHTVSKLYINNTVTFLSNNFYYLSIWTGLLGFLLLIRPVFRLNIESIIVFIPVYIIIIHPFFIKYSENRYLIPAYPFILVSAIYCFRWLYHKISGKVQKPNNA